MNHRSPCDCTHHCGDDPAIKHGNATPCAEHTARLARQARANEASALRKELGITDELDALTRLQQLMQAGS